MYFSNIYLKRYYIFRDCYLINKLFYIFESTRNIIISSTSFIYFRLINLFLMIDFFFLLFIDLVWKIQSTLDIALIGIIRFHRKFKNLKKTHQYHAIDLHLKTTKLKNLLKNVSHMYAQTFIRITILDKFPNKSRFKILIHSSDRNNYS